MIKLSDDKIKLIGDDYLKKILPLIKIKYDSEKHKLLKLKYFGIEIKDIFSCADSSLDLFFVSDLLLKPFSELEVIYPKIKNYSNICKLLSFAPINIDSCLKRNNIMSNKKNRIEYRKRHVETYTSSWLEDYFINEVDYDNANSFKNEIGRVKAELDKLNHSINEIISYDLMDNEIRNFLLYNMNVNTCPYCNRQYITSYFLNDNEIKSTADLDHFYPKSIFTLFSLSIYNFIPSCQICNSRFKLAKLENIMYPYEEGFDENVFFTVESDDYDSLVGYNNLFNLKLYTKSNDAIKEKIEANAKLFKIDEVYQIHKDYVKELLWKKHIYRQTYRKELINLFSEANFSQDDIDCFLYGYKFEKSTFCERPLSKLTYDIVNRD